MSKPLQIHTLQETLMMIHSMSYVEA